MLKATAVLSITIYAIKSQSCINVKKELKKGTSKDH